MAFVNSGAIAYHIAYLRNKLKEPDGSKRTAQIVVPCAVMGVVILFSVISAIVTCVMFVQRKVNSSAKTGKSGIDYNKLVDKDSDL